MKGIDQIIDQVGALIRQYDWSKSHYDNAKNMADYYEGLRSNSIEMAPSYWQTRERLVNESNEARAGYIQAQHAVEVKLREIKTAVVADGTLQETLKAIAYLRSMPSDFEAVKSGEYAIEIARQGVRRFQSSLELREQLFDLLGKAGKTSELIALMRETLQKSPQDTNFRQRFAEVLEKAGKTDELITLLRESLQKSPQDTSVRQRLTAVLERAGKTEELIALLQEDLQKSPGDLRLKQKIAQQLLKAKGVHEAVVFLDIEIKKTPQDNELRRYLTAFLFDALKNPQDSICLPAIVLLQEREGEHAVEPLKTLFEREQDAGIRLKAIRALVNIQRNKAISSLWNGLIDKSIPVRSYSAQALGEVGDASLVDKLARELNAQTDDTVRNAIMSSLSKLDARPRKWWEKMLNSRPWAH